MLITTQSKFSFHSCSSEFCKYNIICTRYGEPLVVKSRNNKASSAYSDVNVVFSPSVELPNENGTHPKRV